MKKRPASKKKESVNPAMLRSGINISYEMPESLDEWGLPKAVVDEARLKSLKAILMATELGESIDSWGVILQESSLPKSQVQFLKDKRKKFLAQNPEYKALEKKLLSLGGEFVALQHDNDLKALVSRGTEPSLPVKLVSGDVSRCHSNTACLWDENKSKGFKIWTGWVLDDDGIWRQHTWGELQGKIIETTSKREKYFGIQLTDEESKKFYSANY